MNVINDIEWVCPLLADFTNLGVYLYWVMFKGAIALGFIAFSIGYYYTWPLYCKLLVVVLLSASVLVFGLVLIFFLVMLQLITLCAHYWAIREDKKFEEELMNRRRKCYE